MGKLGGMGLAKHVMLGLEMPVSWKNGTCTQIHTDCFLKGQLSCLRDCSVGWDTILRTFHPTIYNNNWVCYFAIPIKLNANVPL